ncbi:hypothetical protein WS64_25665 [Burkholderia anthina]|uniref:Uncharacterized protein n=1 Tax=Burkholderia anthina TaxID=179879 RepID=A0AAW3PTE3_9BURK|nr:hypothetical protein WS64_25665 [Burkholderia anthina]
MLTQQSCVHILMEKFINLVPYSLRQDQIVQAPPSGHVIYQLRDTLRQCRRIGCLHILRRCSRLSAASRPRISKNCFHSSLHGAAVAAEIRLGHSSSIVSYV